MLSAQAYSFRQKARLAISLSWIGGYVNTVGLVVCGQMVSHVTGSLTSATHEALAGAYGAAAWFAAVVTAFFAGAAAASAITEVRVRRGGGGRYVLPILVEALALTAAAIAANAWEHRIPHDRGVTLVVTSLAAFALGVQNATITRISNSVVRTTHLTGIVTDLGIESVQYGFAARDRLGPARPGRLSRFLRAAPRDPRVQRLLLLASILGSFVLGAVMATVVVARWPHAALLPPVAFLLAIVAIAHAQPIAEVAEVDLFSDAELASLGIERPSLPPGVLVFRPTVDAHRGSRRTADFDAWAARVPRDCRVAIVALDPAVTFRSDGGAALAAATERLAAHGCLLVLSGVTREQYRGLEASGALAAVGRDNVLPDLEFAIAHAVAAASR